MAKNRQAQKRNRRCGYALTAALAAGLLLAGCAAGNNTQSQDVPGISSESLEPVLAQGTSIGGVEVSGMNREQALAAVSAAQQDAPSYHITLRLKDKSWELTEQDLTFESEVQEAVDQAFEDLKNGDSSSRGEGGTRTYSIEQHIDSEKLRERLTALAEEMNIKPKDATVSSFDSATGTFSFADGQNGLSVDVDKLYEAVSEALAESSTATVDVPYTEIPFDKTAAQIRSNMQKLGSYSTVSTNNANANHNMKLALASANGTVLQPGEIFSFNGTTGNTTNGSLGYKKAGAIVGGRMVDDYGGGICQASTTIYGAALRSNMKILTRYNHAWPSTYCPIGQDAAVDYGNLDFRFQNTSEYPVYIVAGMSGTTLTVTFYGYQDPSYDEIRITSQQTGTTAQPADVYQQNDKLKKDEIVKYRTGRSGKRATAQRVYYKNGSVVKTENLSSSYYREIATIYQYGPGTTLPTDGSAPSSSAVSSEITSSAVSTPSSAPESTPSSSAPPVSSAAGEPSAPPSSAPESAPPSSAPAESTISEPAPEPASSAPDTPSSAPQEASSEPASEAPAMG